MDRRLLYFISGLALLLLATTLITLYARGDNFSWTEKKLNKTGIIAVSSSPTGAAVYLNGVLSGATNTTLSRLTPGEYDLKINKEGYSSWEKKVKVEPELVAPIETVLFPSVPELKPLTFTSTFNPKISPDKSKVVFALKNGDRTGLWVLDLSDRPFGLKSDPRPIAKDTSDAAFSTADLQWSPDSKNVLATLKINPDQSKAYLLSIDQQNNNNLNNVTLTQDDIKKSWVKEESLKTKEILATLSKEAQKVATSSTRLDFSPDETKFIAEKDNQVIIYDTKPTPVPNKIEKITQLPKAKQYIWYPDSQHVILVEDKLISIVEIDGANKASIYSGNFDEKVVFPWLNGSKLVISASFNPETASTANLYVINLR